MRYSPFHPSLILFAALGLFLDSEARVAQAQSKKQWTVLVYISGDCDLEDSMLGNLEELMEVGGTEDVNFLALVDRSTKQSPEERDAERGDNGDDKNEEEEDLGGYTNRKVGNLEGWDGAKLIFVQKGHMKSLDDWGESNFGDPETLKSFIETAVADYPAEKYGLILCDHGNSWKGACWDESADSDGLTIPDIETVLSDVAEKTGRFEFIGFDCCLMGNFEVAMSLAPYARYVIASEQVIPGGGWDYVPMARLLERQPTADGRELGEVVTNSYRDYFSKADRFWTQWITLSVFDSDKMPELETAVNQLGAALDGYLRNGGDNAWLKVARARSRAMEFGDQCVDLVHFANLLKEHVSDADVSAAAAAAVAAYQTAVPHNIRGNWSPNSFGMSIFFPNNLDNLNGSGDEVYDNLAVASRGQWAPMLRLFCDRAGQQKLTPMIRSVNLDGNIIAPDRAVKLRTSVVDGNPNQIYLAIGWATDQGTQLIGRVEVNPDDGGEIKEQLTDSWYAIANHRGHFHCPIVRWKTFVEGGNDDANQDDADKNEDKGDDQDGGNETETTYAEIDVQWRRSGHTGWTNAIVAFRVEPGAEETDGEFGYAYIRDNRGDRDIEIKKGDYLRPIISTVTPQGKFQNAPDEKAALRIDNLDKLRFQKKPLPTGDFKAGVLAVNVAGVVEAQFDDVRIEE